ARAHALRAAVARGIRPEAAAVRGGGELRQRGTTRGHLPYSSLPCRRRGPRHQGTRPVGDGSPDVRDRHGSRDDGDVGPGLTRRGDQGSGWQRALPGPAHRSLTGGPNLDVEYPGQDSTASLYLHPETVGSRLGERVGEGQGAG